MELDTTTRVSRFAGGTHGGARRIGPISATVPSGTKASIPSRFETLLNSGGHEKHGFGRRTYRFNEAENDLPGPGAYFRPRKMEPKQSSSKKGSAAFASAHRAGFDEDAPRIAPGPGPGSYELAKKPQTPHKSAAFCELQPRKLLKVKTAEHVVPGPGAYVVTESQRVPCGAMSSKSVREILVTKTQPTAGPGEFLPDSHLNLISSSAQPKSGPSFFNKSSSPKDTFLRQIEAQNALPPPMTQEKQSHGNLPPILTEIALERTGPLRPGRHIEAVSPPATKSAVFMESNLDRFGKPTVRYSAANESDVGPGSYQTEQKEKRMLISSSWALSGVARDEIKARYRVPGPAYYEPKQDPKRLSYHMLSRDYWSA